MATIYGTPVILLQKPDTSEEWLLNSSVNVAYFGEDKTFNVDFTSNGASYNMFRLGRAANIIIYGTDTIACTGGNTVDAYRQITLEKPATGDLLTWLEANAVRLPLTGTWVFNKTLTSTKPPSQTNVTFTSNGTEFTNINTNLPSTGITEPCKYYALYYNTTHIASDSNWTNQEFRTITFTEPVKYQGNEEFVRWFVDNAKPLPAKGKTLNEYTWDEISRISLADKAAEYGFKVGDAKEVTLNGSVGYGSSQATFNNQKYWVYIIGINHNEAKEGKGIAFQGFKTAQTGGIDVAVTCTNYNSIGSGIVMNSTSTNSGGWNGSWAYTTCMGQWKSCFSSDLQVVIRTTTLYTDNTGNQSTSESNVTANSNGVYYLADYEVFGSTAGANINEARQQLRYNYYQTGNSKVKYRSDNTGTAARWWLRSPSYKGSTTFCYVDTDGLSSGNTANRSYGSAPCFKV